MKYIIGIDSGGTSSKACIGNKDQILARTTNHGMNPYAFNKETIQRTISDIIQDLLSASNLDIKALDLIMICGAGLSRQLDQSKLLSIYNSLNLPTPIAFADDAMPLLHSHFEKEAGILLISGTGSIAYGKDMNDLYRCGGYGHLISDEGSGYWIGLEAIKHIFNATDYNQASVFSQPILERLQLKSHDHLLDWVYKSTKKDIASLARIVFDIETCESDIICNTAAEHLIKLIDCTIAKMTYAPMRIILSGSILKYSETIQSKIKNHYKVPVNFASHTAEASALLLGYKHLKQGKVYFPTNND